jgi:beta-N-acetylhexosaminidase
MKRAKARRRRLLLGVLAGVAAGAFVLGAALGDPPPPRLDVADTLSADRLAGQRIVTGFAGTEVTPALRRSIADGRLAGVVLFAGNIPSREAARGLVARLQAIPRPRPLRDPLLVMVDQEGGLVKRVGGAPTASAAQMGRRGAGFSREQGRRTAANLRDLGIDVDLAPVLDVARRGGTIDETDRAFGATAARVEATAVPFAAGLQRGGVAAVAKHFPGLGAAVENTDFAVERIRLPRETLRSVDEAPYRAYVAAGGDLVVLGNAIYPALSSVPAAFSREIAEGELRGRLGFEGVTITDSLETASVRGFAGPGPAAVAAAGGGSDLLLYTSLGAAEKAWRALVDGLHRGSLERERFEDSVQRVLDLRRELAGS